MSGPVGDSIKRHPSSMEPSGRRPSGRTVRVAVVAVLIGTTAALLGFGLGQDPGQIDSPLIGKSAPDFALTSLRSGRTMRMAQLRGQVVVLNFWSSTCTTCRVEDPAIDAVWRRFRDRGVVMAGISFEDSRGDALAYAHELGIRWPLLADPGSKAAIAYGVYGVPETFFIDRSGRVAARQIGAVDYAFLVRKITSLLNRPSTHRMEHGAGRANRGTA